MKTISGYYFKIGKGLISGIDPEKKYHSTLFIDCDFHPNCHGIKFNKCVFENCDLGWNMKDDIKAGNNIIL